MMDRRNEFATYRRHLGEILSGPLKEWGSVLILARVPPSGVTSHAPLAFRSYRTNLLRRDSRTPDIEEPFSTILLTFPDCQWSQLGGSGAAPGLSPSQTSMLGFGEDFTTVHAIPGLRGDPVGVAGAGFEAAMAH